MESPTALATLTRRPSGRAMATAWGVTALATSLVVWLADVAVYDRFGVVSSDLPSGSPWSALELTVLAVAWLAVAALWLWWPHRDGGDCGHRRRLVLGGLGARSWAHHEAERAAGGMSMWPGPVLPFTFTARSTTLVPYGRDQQLPEGIPKEVLMLRYHPDSVTVYDPTSKQTMWMGNQVAVPTWTTGTR